MANNYRGVSGNVPYVSRIVSVILPVALFGTTLHFENVQMAGVLFVNLFAVPFIWWPDSWRTSVGERGRSNCRHPLSGSLRGLFFCFP